MNEKIYVVASIVLYNNDIDILIQTIKSFLNTNLKVELYLVDNSPTDKLCNLATLDSRIKYVHNSSNVGFGAGHNIAIRHYIDTSIYYLVLNPDVYFERGVLEALTEQLNQNQSIGLITPKTLNLDGSIQYLCKMLPTPFDLFTRRFIPNMMKSLFEKRLKEYELRHKDYNEIMEIPYVSGSFMLFKTSVLKDIGLFDENIFMYIEDTDLSRRVTEKYKVVYYPFVSIYHGYAKGSYKSLKLTLINIQSAIYYFNKWGWFKDDWRKLINNKLRQE